jgi:hypothetical protein
LRSAAEHGENSVYNFEIVQVADADSVVQGQLRYHPCIDNRETLPKVRLTSEPAAPGRPSP